MFKMIFKGISPLCDYNNLNVGESTNCKSISVRSVGILSKLKFILPIGNINFNLDKMPTLLATDFEITEI